MFSLAVDFSGLDIAEATVGKLAVVLKQAMPVQLQFIQATWIEAVSGRMLPGMIRPVADWRYAAMIAQPAALQYPFSGDEFSGAVIATDGELAGRIEHGFGSFDMKPGLLSGPNAKVSKKGVRYNTVPFVHSTPGSQGQKGAQMPKELYALAKKLKDGQRLKLEGDMANWGRRSKLPSGVNLQAKVRGQALPMDAPYTWKASPYQGMVRLHKPGHTTYMTFRRVSDNSDANSWMHPGVAANPVIEAVAHYCEPIIKANLERLVMQVIG